MLELNHKYIATSQHGDTIWINRYPRKEIAAYCGVKPQTLSKMYIDDKMGEHHHIGYVWNGGGLWFDVLQVKPFHA